MQVTERTVATGKRVLALLARVDAPVKRAELAQATVDDPAMKPATKERRLREARAWLVGLGYPVLSDGKGFRLAASQEELNAAIRLKERAIAAEGQELAALKRIRFEAFARQRELGFEEAIP